MDSFFPSGRNRELCCALTPRCPPSFRPASPRILAFRSHACVLYSIHLSIYLSIPVYVYVYIYIYIYTYIYIYIHTCVSAETFRTMSSFTTRLTTHAILQPDLVYFFSARFIRFSKMSKCFLQIFAVGYRCKLIMISKGIMLECLFECQT